MLTVWGASYSVYSRVVRLALIEKGLAHDWQEVDVFGDAEAQAAQRARHPFGKVPVLDHDGFMLYETGPILRYLEAPVFGAAALLPAEPRARARAEQIAGICDAYAYRAMVWDVWVELVSKPRDAEAPDMARVQDGLAEARIILGAISALAGNGPAEALVGGRVSHADIFLAPVMDYFASVPPARALLAGFPRLNAWWEAWEFRPSMRATPSPLVDA